MPGEKEAGFRVPVPVAIAVLVSELLDPNARMDILQNRDNLFLCVSCPCHGSLL